MAQFNMINFSLRRKPPKFYNYFSFWKRVEKRQHIYLEGISIDMRKLFFDHLQERAKLEGVEKTSKQRGDGIIGLFTNLSKLRWSVAEVDFDESILLWHMATDLCHYSDLNNTNKDAFHSPYLQMSRLLSDYMLYLLVMCPFMLPKGIGQIRFDLATQQAMSYFQLKDLAGYSSRNEACRILIEVDNEDPPPSMILDGCELAKILQSELKTVTKTNDGSEWEKWKIICHVWVEMLCFAANQCGWRYHAQQLGRGGELLTQISLLMAHFGLTDQMRNTAGDTTGSRQGISRHATSFRDLVDFVDRKEAEVKAMLRRRQFRPMGHTNEYDSENGDLSPMSI
ncbi:uncharacterized protein LOC131164539 isoform X1 [Malania oleifera]|uniref:uncharacterized protein LOC131164539 isoform X1 n=1 Tax=Malania oleifera TaxID=397392 RepID=UPI0025AE7B08|nr:uncharacterized protein LOC131164539 isoform X1 [Malania oleifera]